MNAREITFAPLRRRERERRIAALRQRLRDTLGPNDCSVWLYSCGEAFGYGSLARGDWDGFSDTDLLVVAANQDAAERAADQLMEDLVGDDVLAGDPRPGDLPPAAIPWRTRRRWNWSGRATASRRSPRPRRCWPGWSGWIRGRVEGLKAKANDNEASPVIHAMRSTITARGQTVVPAPIRERFGLGPSTRLEWIVDGDGAIRVVPVDLDPIRAFRGSGAGGGTARLLKERQLDRRKEDGTERVAQLLQAARSGESRFLVCFMSRMEVLDADHLGALQRCPPGAGRRHQGLPSPLAG
jgi:AbrB family looped-hinge helix DNA binding protein